MRRWVARCTARLAAWTTGPDVTVTEHEQSRLQPLHRELAWFAVLTFERDIITELKP